MSYKDIIQKLVGYHVASNRRLWGHLMVHLTDEQFTQSLGYSHGSIRNQVVHLAATDRYWLHDIQSKPVTGLDPQDYPTRESFNTTWEGIETALLEYVNSLADNDLDEVPNGLMENRWEALVHIVNHGTDHRAQIMSMLHRLGTPTYQQEFPDYLRSQRWVSKTDVLKLVRFWHSKLEQALASVPRKKMTEPAVGGWSIKDILAHLTWYEQQVVGALSSRKLAKLELWDLSPEQRNQQIYEVQLSQPLEEVLQEHERVQKALIQEIERLDDEDLNDPSLTREISPGSKLWEFLESNIWVHYMLHTEALWGWLESSQE